jgi:hypothetical protein
MTYLCAYYQSIINYQPTTYYQPQTLLSSTYLQPTHLLPTCFCITNPQPTDQLNYLYITYILFTYSLYLFFIYYSIQTYLSLTSLLVTKLYASTPFKINITHAMFKMVIFDIIEMGKGPSHIGHTTLGWGKKKKKTLMSFKISK